MTEFASVGRETPLNDLYDFSDWAPSEMGHRTLCERGIADQGCYHCGTSYSHTHDCGNHNKSHMHGHLVRDQPRSSSMGANTHPDALLLENHVSSGQSSSGHSMPALLAAIRSNGLAI